MPPDELASTPPDELTSTPPDELTSTPPDEITSTPPDEITSTPPSGASSSSSGGGWFDRAKAQIPEITWRQGFLGLGLAVFLVVVVFVVMSRLTTTQNEADLDGTLWACDTIEPLQLQFAAPYLISYEGDGPRVGRYEVKEDLLIIEPAGMGRSEVMMIDVSDDRLNVERRYLDDRYSCQSITRIMTREGAMRAHCERVCGRYLEVFSDFVLKDKFEMTINLDATREECALECDGEFLRCNAELDDLRADDISQQRLQSKAFKCRASGPMTNVQRAQIERFLEEEARQEKVARCEASTGCRREGECGYHDIHGCTPTRAEHCAQSIICKTDGRCDLDGGRCLPTKPEHCLQSTGCKEDRKCRLRPLGSFQHCSYDF